MGERERKSIDRVVKRALEEEAGERERKVLDRVIKIIFEKEARKRGRKWWERVVERVAKREAREKWRERGERVVERVSKREVREREGGRLLQLKSTSTLPLPKMIKNDSERICYALTTHWMALLCISFHVKRGYSSWIYDIVLWTPQSPSISRDYQDFYRVYLANTIRSTAKPKALQSQCTLKLSIGFTYLNHKPGKRRLVTQEEGSAVSPKSPPIVHDYWCTQPLPFPRFDCLEKMYRNRTLL
jgi:hypothetical protein